MPQARRTALELLLPSSPSPSPSLLLLLLANVTLYSLVSIIEYPSNIYSVLAIFLVRLEWSWTRGSLGP